MPDVATDVDVLIAGAGPVGLFLANECARRNLRWRIVEANAGQSEHSKALAVFSRTLEIFDMAGVVDRFVEAANRVTKVAFVSHGRTLARMKFAPEESPYAFVGMVPQDVTERLLAEALHRKGGTIEYNTRLVSAIDEGDRVRVTLERDGEHLESTASFVVGCDGAHSTVRHLLNLPFEGAEYRASFMLADIETNETLPGDEMQLCPNAAGPVAIFPMSSTRRRVVAMVDSEQGEAPSLEFVREVLAQRAPAGIEALSLHWSSYFRIHHRHVAALQKGRIFVAGDAAHIHSPFGGQGMNTGLQDAWNLVWKLDLAVRGHASTELLESYTMERLPVIKHVIEVTHLMTNALGAPNKLAQAVRDTVIPVVSHIASFQHGFVQTLSELGVAYAGSPIVEGSGKRYFDDSLRGGKGIGSRYLLMVGDGADAATFEAAKELSVSFAPVLQLRLHPNHGIALVRPDGYAAYSAYGDGAAQLQPVRELLERQTK